MEVFYILGGKYGIDSNYTILKRGHSKHFVVSITAEK